MGSNISLPTLSLRTKFVLSYLAVIIGTVLVLSFAVSQAIESYFTRAQMDYLTSVAKSLAYKIERTYLISGGGWRNGRFLVDTPDGPVFLVAEDTEGNQHICVRSHSVLTDCNNTLIKKILNQTIQTQKVSLDKIDVQTTTSVASSLYVSMPLQLGGHPIGALFLSEPFQSNNDFIRQVNQAILIAGLVVAGIALLASILLVRRLTQPLEELTAVAEQMKQGEYTQRASLPRKLDELGQLGLTFNEMADTIEADITELRRQDQVRRDLIANIAHDLATPLTAIQGFSEALADNVISDPNEHQETAQRIGREVQRLRRLVAEIQQMSSLEAGHAKLDLAPLDMHDQVEETIAVITPECEHKGIAVHNDINPSTPLVIADGNRITQVLLNLLDNACRHTLAGGDIRVGATSQGNDLRVWISDTGTGIDPADLPYIFERFYRADRSRTTSTGGSGLGLSIVKAIIIAHGGNIWAESTPGQGTRIIFTLPIANQTQTMTPSNTTGTSPRRTRATVPTT